jgi:hypothetical protein
MDTGFVIFRLVIICFGLAYYAVGQKGDNVSLRLQLEAEAKN